MTTLTKLPASWQRKEPVPSETSELLFFDGAKIRPTK